MKYIMNFFKRWNNNFVILFILAIFWLILTYYLNHEKYPIPQDIIPDMLRGLIELFMFLILVKIIMGTNAVLNSLDSLFQRVYFKRSFLKTLKHEHLLKLANDIQSADPTIIFSDETKRQEAFKALEDEWYNHGKVKPFIVLESEYIDTLYDDGQIIMYKKYYIKMMERAYFEINYDYIPFDENINTTIKNEAYYTNQPGERWKEKSFKHKISDGHKASIKLDAIDKNDKNDKKWLRFMMKSTLKIDKGEEFIFEFSMTDKVSLNDSLESKTRRNQFFSTDFSSIIHGVRNLTFQIESYNDMNDINKKTPFKPVLFIDDDQPNDIKSKEEETIYYKKWSWQIIKATQIPRKIRFELHEL